MSLTCGLSISSLLVVSSFSVSRNTVCLVCGPAKLNKIISQHRTGGKKGEQIISLVNRGAVVVELESKMAGLDNDPTSATDIFSLVAPGQTIRSRRSIHLSTSHGPQDVAEEPRSCAFLRASPIVPIRIS